MLETLESYPAKIGELIERYKIKDAVFEMMNLARTGNKYFNDSEPWKTIKSDKEKCATTINVCLRAIFTLAELFEPVIPFSSNKIFKMLNVSKDELPEWNSCGRFAFKPGHKLGEPEILFTKIEDKTIEDQINKLGSTGEQPKEIIEEISIEEFKKIKLRVALITAAEKVKKSQKLLKLQVDLGNEKRQVVAGIAKSYEPEQLIGKKILMVANLKAAKLFGLDSQGMLLAVDTSEDGKVKLIEIDDSIKIGTTAK